MTSEIQCPKCKTPISINEVLRLQIEEKIQNEFEKKQKEKEMEFSKKENELKRQKVELETKKSEIDSIVTEKVLNQLSSEKIKLYKEAKRSIEKEQADKMSLLQAELENKNIKLKKANQVEVELLKKTMQLASEKEAFELEKIRQIEEAKSTIMTEARQKALEESQYKLAQLQKQLQDSIKAKDELARKLEQGSQKSQGQVFEVALGEILKTEFSMDEICAVPIGMSGADIIQQVNDNSGRFCGQIIWETKNTKTWNEAWIQKLKDDQRSIKAELAILVSAVLPNDIKHFGLRDGIWICDFNSVVGLATALRMNLESITREKRMSIGKNEKMESLYAYLTGTEFKQRVEAIVESFSNMNASLQKERAAYEKIWAEREKNLKKILNNTSGMYGDLCGLVALQQIKMLEIGHPLITDGGV